MALFVHSIASLVMAEFAYANLIFSSFTDVPFSVCVEAKYFGDDFHAVFSLYFLQSLSELLQSLSLLPSRSMSSANRTVGH